MVGIGSTAGTNAELQIKSGTKPHWGIYQDEANEELRFWNGSNRVVFGSGGNVGIGTSSPGAKLEVNGADTTVYTSTGSTARIPTGITTTINNTNGTAGNASFVDLLAQGQHAWIGSIASVSGYTPSTVFGRSTGAATWAESMRIDTSGNVGIGTPSPVALIHGSKVIANSSSSIRIENYSLAAGANANFQASSKDVDGTLRTWYMGVGSSSLIGGTKQNYLGFWNTSDYSNAKVVIDYAGNVGIGRTDPGVKLHVL